MSYWDMIPNDLQEKIFQIRAADTIKRNWCRRPYIASSLAKTIILASDRIDIGYSSPWSATALEYCVKHSNKHDSSFWVNVCLELLDKRIEYEYASDYGHRWIERSHDAFDSLVDKYSDSWCYEYNKTLKDTVNMIQFQGIMNSQYTAVFFG